VEVHQPSLKPRTVLIALVDIPIFLLVPLEFSTSVVNEFWRNRIS